jgi:hypothetical protein
MQIIQGRGRNRKVIQLPHGSIFAQAAKDEPAEYARAVGAVLDLTLGNPVCLRLTQPRYNRLVTRTAGFRQPERKPIILKTVSRVYDRQNRLVAEFPITQVLA